MAKPELRDIDGRRWFPTFAGFIEAGLVDVVDDYDGANTNIYDHVRDDVGAELTFYRERIQALGNRVLELGCGTGSLTIPLAREGARITGIDSSPAMIKRLRSKAAGVSTIVADMAEYVADAAASYDLIIIPYNALVHVLNADARLRLFSSAAQALRPGGELVVDIWLPRRRPRSAAPGWWTVSAPGGGWMIYSEQSFPTRGRRVANLLTVPVQEGRPFVTSIIEHVFTRRELLNLFKSSGFRTRVLPLDHALVGGRAERLVVVGCNR